jgi:hypothetical protein
MIREPIDRAVISAQPGWFVVVPDDQQKLFRVPVVAWQCEIFRAGDRDETFPVVTPLLCVGGVDDMGDYALQFGDGPPFHTWGETFEDEPALLAFFHDATRRRERPPAMPAK